MNFMNSKATEVPEQDQIKAFNKSQDLNFDEKPEKKKRKASNILTQEKDKKNSKDLAD